VSIAGQPAGVEEARARIRVSSLRNARESWATPSSCVLQFTVRCNVHRIILPWQLLAAVSCLSHLERGKRAKEP